MTGNAITRGGGRDVALDTGAGLRLSQLEFTDLYISQNGHALLRGAGDAAGPLTGIPDNVVEDLDHLHIALMAHAQSQQKEFYLDFDGVRYRVSRIRDIDGDWFALRKPMTQIPRLASLGGFQIPVMRHLAWLGKRSGLILIAGATGQGKTTTACSLLKEYLSTFGGMAITIEDPPEMVLNGAHGNFGHCFQIRLEENETFGSALVSAMRYTPRYIFLGELRKPHDASQALRAAISGHLVISTIHAGNVQEAINSMIKLAAAEEASLEFARDQLANGLAGVIHQTLETIPSRHGQKGGKKLSLETLFFGTDRGLRALVRDGSVAQLGTAIEQQRSLVNMGKEPVTTQVVKNGR